MGGQWNTAVELAEVVMKALPGDRAENMYELAVFACRLDRLKEARHWIGKAMDLGGRHETPRPGGSTTHQGLAGAMRQRREVVSSPTVGAGTRPNCPRLPKMVVPVADVSWARGLQPQSEGRVRAWFSSPLKNFGKD